MATAWRYIDEVVALLAARAPKLRRAVRDAVKAGYAYVVLDGTLIPIDRVARATGRSTPASTRHPIFVAPGEGRREAKAQIWSVARPVVLGQE